MATSAPFSSWVPVGNLRRYGAIHAFSANGFTQAGWEYSRAFSLQHFSLSSAGRITSRHTIKAMSYEGKLWQQECPPASGSSICWFVTEAFGCKGACIIERHQSQPRRDARTEVVELEHANERRVHRQREQLRERRSLCRQRLYQQLQRRPCKLLEICAEPHRKQFNMHPRIHRRCVVAVVQQQSFEWRGVSSRCISLMPRLNCGETDSILQTATVYQWKPT